MSLRLCQIQRTLPIVDLPRNVRPGGKEDAGHLEVGVLRGSLKRGPPPVLRGLYVCSSLQQRLDGFGRPTGGCTVERMDHGGVFGRHACLCSLLKEQRDRLRVAEERRQVKRRKTVG